MAAPIRIWSACRLPAITAVAAPAAAPIPAPFAVLSGLVTSSRPVVPSRRGSRGVESFLWVAQPVPRPSSKPIAIQRLRPFSRIGMPPVVRQTTLQDALPDSSGRIERTNVERGGRAERVTRTFLVERLKPATDCYERGGSGGAVARAERRWGGCLTSSSLSFDCSWNSGGRPCGPHRVDRFACVGRLE